MIYTKRKVGIFALVLLGLVVAAFIIIKFYGSKGDKETLPERVYNEFGICEDDWDSVVDLVKPNQTMSDVFLSLNFSQAESNKIISRMVNDNLFDPRRFRAGRTFLAYYDIDDQDINRKPRHLFYEINNIDYLHFVLKDTLQVFRKQKEVTVVPKIASGLITSSLWNTIAAQGAHRDLAIRMSEIFAWEVDFFRIQKGDGFKVIYGENHIGERSIGLERIEAIYFSNLGRCLFGFFFESDSISDFFNEKGESLRKAFLRAPLEFGRITSRFSHNRLHPVLRVRRPHHGTDYAAPRGTPILAVGDGVVTRAAYNSGNGNYVRIRHNSVYETQYLHMSRFGKGIKPGTRVRQGQVIGYVGSTGLATGPHVCFRFWKNGKQVDHLREEFPTQEPIPKRYMKEFITLKEGLMARLNEIEMKEWSGGRGEEDENEE